MKLQINESPTDRAVRIVIGLALLAIGNLLARFLARGALIGAAVVCMLTA